MAIYKRCNNCHNLFQGRFCVDCRNKLSKRANRRKPEDTSKLYDTAAWQKCRKTIRLKYLDIDIWLLAVGQIYRCESPLIHHIIERDEAPELIFHEENLIPVSKESHEEIHKLYRVDRKSALARIEKGKEEFRRLFGND